MERSKSPGLIFISHSSKDKRFVEAVTDQIPKSHMFYDVDTIDPGNYTIDALDDGLLQASVFAIFVSPNTPKSVWVEYESGVAYVQKIKRQNLIIVVIPISGASFQDAPSWMQSYMAVPPGYSSSDIARLLSSCYERSLRNQGLLAPELFVGREHFCNSVAVDIRSRSAGAGIAVNFLIFAGIPNMGRFTVAKHVMPKVFPGSRHDTPIFDLSKYADAIDLFIALRQDITGESGLSWSKEQISSFPVEALEQAKVLAENLDHYAMINQTVVIRSAFGLRNQDRSSKEWLEGLFGEMRRKPNIRVVWISDRLLSPETLSSNANVMQFHVQEIATSDIAYLLTELLDVTASSPEILQRIAPHIHGHPASAHYVAQLIRNSQRSPETIIERPDALSLFQSKFVKEAIGVESIGTIGQGVVGLLRILPWASFDLIAHVFPRASRSDLARTLWDMTDNCVVGFSLNAGYKLAEIVRMSITAGGFEVSVETLQNLADYLRTQLNSKLSHYAVEALIFISVRMKGEIPTELRDVLTGATLLSLVEQYYSMGYQLTGNWAESFRTAARLALLASKIPTSPDIFENILFNGADSLIRVGDDPSHIANIMQEKRLKSHSYIMGSYYYHQRHDPDTAIPFLEKALKDGAFTKRTGRLLAKIYMEKGLPKAGLHVFSVLGDRRVNRDAGLLAQKIRCLRACGQAAEANKLILAMRSLEDEFGEYEALTAARLMKDGKFDDALNAIERARAKPKANRVNLKLLEAAVLIEKGDTSLLEETCSMASAIGLSNGASSLRARAFIYSGHWRSAETELMKITEKNFHDKLLRLRMLTLKKEDLEVIADPRLYTETKKSHESLLVELRRENDGDFAYYDT